MLCIYEGREGSVPHSLEWKVLYFTFITFVAILIIVSCKFHKKNRFYWVPVLTAEMYQIQLLNSTYELTALRGHSIQYRVWTEKGEGDGD